MDTEDLGAWLGQHMAARRLAHARGVATTSADLARAHGLDGERAGLAGLLHDVARDIHPSRLLQMAESFGIVEEGMGTANPVLLHGPVAAVMIQRDLGVHDPEVLEAVRVHSTGAPDMGRIAQVVFVADRTEPGRDYPEREGILATARGDLDEGTRQALGATLRWLLQQGIPIDTATVATYNAFLRGRASG